MIHDDLSAPGPAHQLALALDHPVSFDRADFLVGAANQSALALIDGWPDWPARMVALVGPEGAGKSHLAAIWATTAGAQMIMNDAVDVQSAPRALATGALVIEDTGRDGRNEAALFHLLNLANERRAFVLMTARQAPASWPIGLPDLASRLRALPVVNLEAPDDALLAAVLAKLFTDRQLAIDVRLIDFVARRIERSFAGARAAVDELDREALRLQRPVNRRLAAEVLRRRGT